MDDQELIARYSQLSENEIFEALGASLLGDGYLGIGAGGQSRRRRFGRDKWVDSQRVLRRSLCTEDGTFRLGDEGTAIAQGLVAAVVETLGLNHVEAAMISVLLLKQGLDRFCAVAQPEPDS